MKAPVRIPVVCKHAVTIVDRVLSGDPTSRGHNEGAICISVVDYENVR